VSCHIFQVRSTFALFFRSQSRIFETCGGLTISSATKVAVMI
jgi:hypothetical protein